MCHACLVSTVLGMGFTAIALCMVTAMSPFPNPLTSIFKDLTIYLSTWTSGPLGQKQTLTKGRY